jgi:hypothetical protein
LPDGELLDDAFAKAFTEDKIRSVWGEKIGVLPFTRKALGSKKIRHENVQTEDGEADTAADPRADYIKELNEMNSTCCEILNSFGYAGNLLKIDLPVVSNVQRQQQLTKPHTRERQDAIANAKSQGGRFGRTGGSTYNDDDFFIGGGRKNVSADVKKLEAEKVKRIKTTARAQKAFALVESERPDKDYTSEEIKTMIAWKTGKPCPSKVSGKQGRRDLWESVKNSAPPEDTTWNDDDEQRLVQMKYLVENITVNETSLGRKREEQKQLLFSTFLNMSAEERREFQGRLGLVDPDAQVRQGATD